MRHEMNLRAKAARYFEMGFADKLVGRLLGIPHDTVRRRLYTYRALGKEALFVTKRRTYPHRLKVEAAHAVVEGDMTKPEALAAFSIKGRSRSTTGAGSTGRAAQTRSSPSRRAGPGRSRPLLLPRGGEGDAGARAGAGERDLKTNRRLSGRDRARIADTLRREHSPKLVLDKLRLFRNTYWRYAGSKNPRRDRWSGVCPPVREVFARTPNGMGYRQVAMTLRIEHGLAVSGKTVLRLMREEGLRCRIKRRRYDSYRGEQAEAVRNVLNRNFTAEAR